MASSNHEDEPLTPSTMGSPRIWKLSACNDCRQKKRRCIHDEDGNLDPCKATRVNAPSLAKVYKQIGSNPPGQYISLAQDENQDTLMRTKDKSYSLQGSSLNDDWEEFGHTSKTLDPEEDIGIRPQFADIRLFATLRETPAFFSASLRNAEHQRSGLRKKAIAIASKRMTIKKEPLDREVNIAAGSFHSFVDLSNDDDDDFSSPKSRKHKLAEKQLGGPVNVAGTSSKESLKRDKKWHEVEYVVTSKLNSDARININSHNDAGQSSQIATVEKVIPSSVKFWPDKHKRILAIAAEKALFEDPFNSIRKIFTTEILTFLDETSSFEGLCKGFERKRFRVNRTFLAQKLLAAVPELKNTTCFAQSDSDSGLSKKITSTVQSGDGQPTEEAADLHITEAAQVKNAELSTPGIRAPVANMGFRPQPSSSDLDMHPLSLSQPDTAQIVDCESASDSSTQLRDNNTGLSVETVKHTLSEMEHVIRLQRQGKEAATREASCVPQSLNPEEQVQKAKSLDAQKRRDAILKEETRKLLEGSKPSVLKRVSGSQDTGGVGSTSHGTNNKFGRSWLHSDMTASGPTGNPNSSTAKDPQGSYNEPMPRLSSEEVKHSRTSSPDVAGSNLFLPAIETTDSHQDRHQPPQERIAFGEWADRNNEVRSVVRKKPQEGPTLLDFFSPEKKRLEVIARTRTKSTLEPGFFARHQERKKALVEGAKRQKSGDQGGFNGQEVDLEEAGDAYNCATQGHPTTGGKGISKATRRQWKSGPAEEVYVTPSESESDEGELAEPEALYHYHVHVREWLATESEADAPVRALGPYYTVAEANAVASNSVRKPSEDNRATIFRRGAWSYNYSKDANGMETHAAGSSGGTMEASVSRTLKPPDQQTRLPAGSFSVPRVVYLALYQPLPPSILHEDDLFGDMQPEPSTKTQNRTLATTLKACTTLQLANKTASQKWLEHQTRHFLADSLGNLRRAELETSLRKQLRQMDDENVSFDRTSRDETSGEIIHVWVEMVDIDGPRN